MIKVGIRAYLIMIFDTHAKSIHKNCQEDSLLKCSVFHEPLYPLLQTTNGTHTPINNVIKYTSTRYNLIFHILFWALIIVIQKVAA